MGVLRACLATALLAVGILVTTPAAASAGSFTGLGELSLVGGAAWPCLFEASGSATINLDGDGIGWVEEFDASACAPPFDSVEAVDLPWAVSFDATGDDALILDPAFEVHYTVGGMPVMCTLSAASLTPEYTYHPWGTGAFEFWHLLNGSCGLFYLDGTLHLEFT